MKTAIMNRQVRHEIVMELLQQTEVKIYSLLINKMADKAQIQVVNLVVNLAVKVQDRAQDKAAKEGDKA